MLVFVIGGLLLLLLLLLLILNAWKRQLQSLSFHQGSSSELESLKRSNQEIIEVPYKALGKPTDLFISLWLL